jgi:hypothetical protein
MTQPSVLLYFREDDPYHRNSTIEIGAIREPGKKHGFALEATEDRGVCENEQLLLMGDWCELVY